MWAVVTEGVRPEWMVTKEGKPTTFAQLLRRTLGFFFNVAKHKRVYFLPDPPLILESFRWLSPGEVKVVITAQDPYPNRLDACGVAFQSFNKRCPRSARMIGRNLAQYGHIPSDLAEVADYRPWLKQGVLLINRSLTAEEGRSHGTDWIGVIDAALQLIGTNTVAVLMGSDAKSIINTLRSKKIVESVHPAERTDAFLDQDVFGQINAALASLKMDPINWRPGL